MVSRHRENDAQEARAVVEAIRAFHANPQLLDEARNDLPAALDRLGLSDTGRHAVGATLSLGMAGVLLIPGSPFFWAA